VCCPLDMFVKEVCEFVTNPAQKSSQEVTSITSKGATVGKVGTSQKSKWVNDVIELDSHPEAELFSREAHPSLTRVLLAGLESFAELGYHGTATRDITRRAGISAGGLYTHFESKQAILQKISSVTHEAMFNRMRQASENSTSPTEQLEYLVREHASFHAHYPTAGRVANYELHSLDANARKEMQKYRRSMEEMVTAVLEAGQVTGEFDVPNVKIFSKFILSSGIDISRWFRTNGQLGPDDLGVLYSEMVLNSASAKRSARKSAHPKTASSVSRKS
jgi:AcrR family transcriptional regulator